MQGHGVDAYSCWHQAKAGQPHKLEFTPAGNIEPAVACKSVGGSQSPRREPTQIRGEDANPCLVQIMCRETLNVVLLHQADGSVQHLNICMKLDTGEHEGKCFTNNHSSYSDTCSLSQLLITIKCPKATDCLHLIKERAAAEALFQGKEHYWRKSANKKWKESEKGGKNDCIKMKEISFKVLKSWPDSGQRSEDCSSHLMHDCWWIIATIFFWSRPLDVSSLSQPAARYPLFVPVFRVAEELNTSSRTNFTDFFFFFRIVVHHTLQDIYWD